MARAIPEPPKTTWEEASDDFLNHWGATRAKKTVAFYKCRMSVLIKWAKDQNIALQDFAGRNMSSYLNARAKAPNRRGGTVSDLTRRQDAVAAKVFFKFCYEARLIEKDPLKDYSIPRASRRKVRCPSQSEVKEVIRSIWRRWDLDRNPGIRYIEPKRRKFCSTRNVAIVAGLVDTACRISEMLNLKLEDYHPEEHYVIFRDTKGNEDRDVPISDDWIALVTEWLKIRPKGEHTNIFLSEYGEPEHPNIFGKVFREQLQWAGLSGFTLHGLRHYSATIHAERNLLGTQYILGHKSLNTTQTYTHTKFLLAQQVHAETGALSNVLNEQEEQEKPIVKIMVNKRTEQQKEAKQRKRVF